MTDTIHQAAERGDALAVSKFLQQDRKLLYARDEKNLTPLHWACLNGHIDAVAILTQDFADINVDDGPYDDLTDGQSWTPLGMALCNDHVGIVNHLLQLDARASNMERYHAAILDGDLDWIKLLVKDNARLLGSMYEHYGSYSMAPDGSYDTHRACAGGNIEVVKYLLDHVILEDWERPDHAGDTPLFIAAQKGHFDIARLLVQKGVAVNGDYGTADETLLDRAIWKQSQEAIKVLESLGARKLEDLEEANLA